MGIEKPINYIEWRSVDLILKRWLPVGLELTTISLLDLSAADCAMIADGVPLLVVLLNSF